VKRDDAVSWEELERLFEQTLDLDDDAVRTMLERLAARRPDLAAELSRLVEADRGRDAIAERLQRFAEAEFDGSGLQPGQRVGPYAIRRLLGRGGMGAVYLAERDDDAYRQRAVVKLVDAPMSVSLHARFQRERQILADLAHPHIARLLDGGSLSDGTPYLVMEYVDGTSISKYCDDRELGLRDRVGLFRQVADAVQFAHANLVVHRDIKPDNVLVDADGRVRLLDFGIAKLLEGPTLAEPEALGEPAVAGERTLHGAALLSPAYASPEQLRGEAITTATDIYGLGALLYRLVTGRAPGDRAGAGNPPEPPSVAAARLDDAPVAPGVDRDLDAIVGRALAEKPADRYRSAGALIDDLDRWLGHRPVSARRSGWLEHTAKFARRNRALSATLVATAVIVIGFSIGISWLALRLSDERAEALESAQTTEQIADYLVGLFGAADPTENAGENLTARALLDRGVERIRSQSGMDPAVRSRLLHRMGLAYRNLGVRDDAVPLYREALALIDDRAGEHEWQIRLELADLLRETSEFDEAGRRLRAAMTELEHAGGPAEMLAKVYNDYGLLFENQERFDEAELWARRALDVAAALPPSTDNEVRLARFRHNLAIALSSQGRHDEAIELLEAVVADKRDLLGEEHPSTLLSMEVLATTLRTANRLERAATLLTDALAARKRIFRPGALPLARVGNELANVYHDAGRYRQAERAYRDALAVIETDAERDPLLHAFLINNLASLYEDQGDLDRAEPLFRHSVQKRITLSGSDGLAVVRARINLARLLIKRGELSEAGDLLDAVETTLNEHFPGNRYRALLAQTQRAQLEAAAGNPDAGWRRLQATLDELQSLGASAAFGLRRARIDAARMRLDAGSPESALQLLDAVWETLPASLGPAHPQRQIVRVLRAQALLALGRADEARRLAVSAVGQIETQFSADADIVARAREVVARTTSPSV
jgi:serine/threonine-protein kinase